MGRPSIESAMLQCSTLSGHFVEGTFRGAFIEMIRVCFLLRPVLLVLVHILQFYA